MRSHVRKVEEAITAGDARKPVGIRRRAEIMRAAQSGIIHRNGPAEGLPPQPARKKLGG
jgi:ribosomal protein S20